jgi:hypothetical protein
MQRMMAIARCNHLQLNQTGGFAKHPLTTTAIAKPINGRKVNPNGDPGAPWFVTVMHHCALDLESESRQGRFSLGRRDSSCLIGVGNRASFVRRFA